MISNVRGYQDLRGHGFSPPEFLVPSSPVVTVFPV